MSTSRALGVLAALAFLGSAGAALGKPAVPDPGEEITPEELASIPEPVPATPGGGRVQTPHMPAGGAQTAPQGVSAKLGQAYADPAGALWRVQVLATLDRELAERTAGEAARLLHVNAHVAHEASHYKVRLGDYRSEEEARPLRDQAIRAGYTGAFRTLCTPDTTLNNN